MLQQEQPEDFVIATGVQYSVRQFVEMAAAELGIDAALRGRGRRRDRHRRRRSTATRRKCKPGEVIVAVDPRYFRPTEVETLLGDPTKAKAKLGWTPKIDAAGAGARDGRGRLRRGPARQPGQAAPASRPTTTTSSRRSSVWIGP